MTPQRAAFYYKCTLITLGNFPSCREMKCAFTEMIGVFGWQQSSVEIGGGAAMGKTHTGIDEKCA